MDRRTSLDGLRDGGSHHLVPTCATTLCCVDLENRNHFDVTNTCRHDVSVSHRNVAAPAGGAHPDHDPGTLQRCDLQRRPHLPGCEHRLTEGRDVWVMSRHTPPSATRTARRRSGDARAPPTRRRPTSSTSPSPAPDDARVLGATGNGDVTATATEPRHGHPGVRGLRVDPAGAVARAQPRRLLRLPPQRRPLGERRRRLERHARPARADRGRARWDGCRARRQPLADAPRRHAARRLVRRADGPAVDDAPTTPPTTTEPTDEPDPTQEPTEETTTPTEEPSTGAPTDDATGTPTDGGVDDSEGDDDATDDPRDDAAGPSDGGLPVTGVAGGAVAAVLAAVLLTVGAVLRSRREQEV